MSKAKTYREIYKEYFNVDFDADMSIHHIDYNYRNNSIDNLLLLPRKLHNKYHAIVLHLKGNDTGIIDGNMRLYPSVVRKASYVNTLYLTVQEIKPWIDLKYNMERNIERRERRYEEIFPTLEIISLYEDACFVGNTLIIGNKAKQFMKQPDCERVTPREGN